MMPPASTCGMILVANYTGLGCVISNIRSSPSKTKAEPYLVMIFKIFRHALRHSQPSLFRPNPQIRFGWRSINDESLPSDGSQLLSDHLKQIHLAVTNVVNDLSAVDASEMERGVY
jgi:hypothetical protein